MRVPRLPLIGAAGALLAGPMLIGAAAPAGAVSAPPPKAAVFMNGDYVDAGDGDEAQNVLTTLTDGGVQTSTFTGITAPDFTAALAGQDLLVIPELEMDEGEPGDLAADMGADSRAVVKNWVDAGGRLIVFGSSTPWVDVDAIFGTNYEGDQFNEICKTPAEQPEGSSLANGGAAVTAGLADEPCNKTAAAANTEFAEGPATLMYNDDTSTTPINLPTGTHTVYDWVNGEAAVTAIPQGHGSIVFLAYDWFAAYGNDDGAATSAEANPNIDAGWFDVLLLATDATVVVNDASAVEGAPVTFTISLPGGPVAQDVVVTYASADGTAVAGTDYTAVNGTAVIPTGQTSVTVQVPTIVRAGAQGARTLNLNIDAPFWAQVADPTGVGTITDAPEPTTTTTTAPPVTAAVAVVAQPHFTG